MNKRINQLNFEEISELIRKILYNYDPGNLIADRDLIKEIINTYLNFLNEDSSIYDDLLVTVDRNNWIIAFTILKQIYNNNIKNE